METRENGGDEEYPNEAEEDSADNESDEGMETEEGSALESSAADGLKPALQTSTDSQNGLKPALQTPAKDRVYTLIDTAGLRRRGKIERGVEKLSVFAAEASLRRCDVALVLLDASQGLTEQDQHVAGYAHEEKRGCILIVNKWDLLEKDSGTSGQVAKMLRREMGFLNYAPILMISAKTGQRVHRILDLVDKVYAECTREIDTPTLNEWLAETTQRLSPPFRKGQQLRIKYVTQVAVRPPTFRFFVNNPNLVHFSYERYLVNRLREAFGFEGAPIRLQFRRKRRKDKDEG
jgi:GTP-binding protein